MLDHFWCRLSQVVLERGLKMVVRIYQFLSPSRRVCFTFLFVLATSDKNYRSDLPEIYH